MMHTDDLKNTPQKSTPMMHTDEIKKPILNKGLSSVWCIDVIKKSMHIDNTALIGVLHHYYIRVVG